MGQCDEGSDENELIRFFVETLPGAEGLVELRYAPPVDGRSSIITRGPNKVTMEAMVAADSTAATVVHHMVRSKRLN